MFSTANRANLKAEAITTTSVTFKESFGEL
jgi:hypothetical protein